MPFKSNYRLPKLITGIFPGLYLLIFLVVSACAKINPPAQIQPSVVPGQSVREYTSTSTIPPTDSLIATKTLSPTETRTPNPSPTPSSTATVQPSPTLSPTLEESLTPTITATYVILRGTVLEQSNCRYGPGAAYLYKYGLYPGNNLEVIGRNEYGTWIMVRAIGGTNPCWLKATLMDVHGDVMSLSQRSMPLPQSPYYGPLTGAHAERKGDTVILSWNPLVLRAGDDSLQYPYLVEAWLCQNGKLVFSPIGSWETIVSVKDEAGCAEPSHARVYGVEKHGYTNWVTIPWPAP